jgi:hypothetical protein
MIIYDIICGVGKIFVAYGLLPLAAGRESRLRSGVTLFHLTTACLGRTGSAPLVEPHGDDGPFGG